jgi:hypothetical protein
LTFATAGKLSLPLCITPFALKLLKVAKSQKTQRGLVKMILYLLLRQFSEDGSEMKEVPPELSSLSFVSLTLFSIIVVLLS